MDNLRPHPRRLQCVSKGLGLLAIEVVRKDNILGVLPRLPGRISRCLIVTCRVRRDAVEAQPPKPRSASSRCASALTTTRGKS